MPHLIRYDGDCVLCNRSINFIFKQDRQKLFFFAKLEKSNPLTTLELATDFELSTTQTFTKSTAVLKIARELSWPWPLFYVFILIPRPIRDFIYDLVARTRYAIFGKYGPEKTCPIPSQELKARIISL